MKATNSAERYLSTEELAEMLGRKPRTIEKDRLRGVGPRFVRMGRLCRYPLSGVHEYLNNLPGGGGAPFSGGFA